MKTMQSKVNDCKELLVYSRLNDVNKEWVNERIEIILEHVTNPSKDVVTAAFKEAVKQCTEIWIPMSKGV